MWLDKCETELTNIISLIFKMVSSGNHKDNGLPLTVCIF